MVTDPIKLTHANWTEPKANAQGVIEEHPVEILVAPEHIYAAFYMPEMKATAVLATSGGNIVVKESKEDVFIMRREGLKNYLPELKVTASEAAEKLIENQGETNE